MARNLRPISAAAIAVTLGLTLPLAAGCSRQPEASAAPASAAPSRGGSLVASVRSDPSTYNRFAPNGMNGPTELVTLLTQARLVRVDRASDRLEPWLAERWETADGGRTCTLHLRRGVVFSDGAPFSAADVVFSLAAAYDPALNSALGESLMVEGRPLTAAATDPHTVVITFPGPSGPGLRLLDNLPILPAHRLRAALAEGRMGTAWSAAGPPSDVVGLGPFVLTEHVSGQRLVFERNPHYFRVDARGQQLPYLDRLTVLIVPDQAAESLKLQAGDVDLLSNANLRPQDQAAFARLRDGGRVQLIDVGVGLDADMLWFNLGDRAPAAAIYRQAAFRQAVSAAIDRQAVANIVYLGAAQPVAGLTSPGNPTWFAGGLPPPAHDPARARALLAGLGLRDRDGDGLLEDDHGQPVRFSLMAQAGHLRGRVAALVQEHLRQVGVQVDLVALDPKAIQQRVMTGDYEAVYYGLDSSSTDPALNLEFWLSRGTMHLWHPEQPTPATPWEAEIDRLMHEQATATDLAVRQRAFAEVQRIVIREAPAISLVAPRIVTAVSSRVRNINPAPQAPQLLWSADTLASAEAAALK